MAEPEAALEHLDVREHRLMLERVALEDFDDGRSHCRSDDSGHLLQDALF
jgi:hypothetical protein